MKRGEKKLDSFLRERGSDILIRWDVGCTSGIMVKGWYERRTFSGGQPAPANWTQALPNLTMNIVINL